MKTNQLIGRGILLLAFLIVSSASADAPDESAVDTSTSEEVAVRAVIADYVTAFNQHDAAAVAALWKEQGVYVDETTQERLVGRESIQSDLQSLFADNQELSVSGRVDTIRFIRPDVVEVRGEASTVRHGDLPRDSRFTAIVVRDGDKWLVDSLYEKLAPPAPELGDQLHALEFLVGHWQDDTDAARVDITVRWGANRSFLVRSYTVNQGEAETYQGTQVIGWDPRQERIRSWMFDSNGSFGEGTWSPSDEGWIVKISQTLADGSAAGGTQVIKIVDENTLTVTSIGREIEGVAIPSSDPVRVMRVDHLTE